ncbi:MAG: flavin reductase [Rhodospirillales bacterium]|nr:flavin reductase [Rhodospirillales bacterium]
MFYEPDKDDHGLRYNPFKSIAVPRPIGWISTVNLDGQVNLAPYSQFQNLGFDPPYVMFSASKSKHSARNAQDTGEFVCNMATYELRHAVNVTAQPVGPEVDEAALAGLEMIPSRLVKAPRVAASPVQLECKYYCAIQLPGRHPGAGDEVVIGRVVGVHIKDEFITADGKIDIVRIRPLARMGYMDYTSIDTVFTMPPLGERAESLSLGLEGRPKREPV